MSSNSAILSRDVASLKGSHMYMTALEECLLGRVQTEFESQIASRNIKTDLKVGNDVPLP